MGNKLKIKTELVFETQVVCSRSNSKETYFRMIRKPKRFFQKVRYHVGKLFLDYQLGVPIMPKGHEIKKGKNYIVRIHELK